jgi:hypothetical protein
MTRKRLAALLALVGALALFTPLRDELEGLVDPGGSSSDSPQPPSEPSGARPDRQGEGADRSSRATIGGAGDDPDVEVGPAAPFAGKPLPPLTATEKQMARAIVAGDAQLKSLVKGERLIEKELVPWGTTVGQKEGERKVGATFVLRLRRPRALSGHWPLIKYGRRRDAANVYTIHRYYLRFRRVPEFMVNVDLERQRVVSIAPGEGAQIAEVPAALRRLADNREGE